MFLQLPTLLLSLTATLCLSWLLTFRRLVARARADDRIGVAQPAADTASPQFGPSLSWPLLQAQALAWIQRNRLELAIALLGLAAGLVILLVSVNAPSNFPRQPGLPGRPYFALKYVRDFAQRYESVWPMAVAVPGALVSAAFLIYAQVKKLPAAAGLGMLVAALGLGCLGQLASTDLYGDDPLVLYTLAILFFAVWAWMAGPALEFTRPTPRPWSWPEVTLLSAIMLLTAYARFYGLQTIPYGIEGDEGRWTVEVVQAMEDHEFRYSTDYHLSSVPASFYMQAPFHRLFGPGLLSARLTVAAFSLLGSLAFYWLARELFGVPVALLATLLLALSIFDISASRLANVESHVKLWPLLALALLARASRVGGLFTYALAGVVTAIALLTYDTLAPLSAVGLFLTVVEILRARIALNQAVRQLLALLVPQLLVAPIVVAYLTGRSLYYDVTRRWTGDILGTLVQHAGELAESFFQSVRGDFLYNREGPLFNSALLPWLLLGTVLALMNWKRGRLTWVLGFAAAFFLPVPLLMNAPMGRVLYPALPAAYLLMALGMVAAVRAAARVLGPSLSPVLYALAGAALVWLGASNLYIYFNEVSDPGDRQIRRELYETARNAASPGAALFFPYVPRADEPIEQETNLIIWLGLRVAEAKGMDTEALVMPAESLLPALAALPVEIDHAEVVWDIVSDTQSSRADILAALLRCYAPVERIEGETFIRYRIDRASLDRPMCRSGTLTLQPERAELAEAEPARLNWSLSGAAADAMGLHCTTLRSDAAIVEAELFDGPGWADLSGFIPGFEGTGFLADNPGSGTAQAEVSLPRGAPIYVWIRTFRRVPDDIPGYLILPGAEFPIGGQTTAATGQWIWERVGEFTPTSREVRVGLERPYPEGVESYLALFVDTLLLTTSPTLNPERDALWSPSIQQTFSIGDTVSEGDFSLHLPAGTHRCALEALGAGTIGPEGSPGLLSNVVELVVRTNEG
ncbi:MAG TPA: glycosyltransferase family 39 protein [Anaerolineales bacterium]